MNYLLVYAHPSEDSFNNAVKEKIIERLEISNRKYKVRNLYKMNFQSSFSSDDDEALKNSDVLEDVHREQNYISNSDVLVFIFPIWWFNMPAVLKGYFDRVFSYGFAFKIGSEGPEGLLKGKKALIFSTAGGSEDLFERYGYKDALEKIFDKGTLSACGIETVMHKFFYNVPSVSHREREEMLNEINKIVW